MQVTGFLKCNFDSIKSWKGEEEVYICCCFCSCNSSWFNNNWCWGWRWWILFWSSRRWRYATCRGVMPCGGLLMATLWAVDGWVSILGWWWALLWELTAVKEEIWSGVWHAKFCPPKVFDPIRGKLFIIVGVARLVTCGTGVGGIIAVDVWWLEKGGTICWLLTKEVWSTPCDGVSIVEVGGVRRADEACVVPRAPAILKDVLIEFCVGLGVVPIAPLLLGLGVEGVITLVTGYSVGIVLPIIYDIWAWIISSSRISKKKLWS